MQLTFQAIDTDLNVDTQLGIEIIILDANDNAPKFNPENYEISVKESTSQGCSWILPRCCYSKISSKLTDSDCVSLTVDRH